MQRERQREITWSEIQKHNTRSSCWVVIHGSVYDLTTFINEVSINSQSNDGSIPLLSLQHPGGANILLDVAGTKQLSILCPQVLM